MIWKLSYAKTNQKVMVNFELAQQTKNVAKLMLTPVINPIATVGHYTYKAFVRRLDKTCRFPKNHQIQ